MKIVAYRPDNDFLFDDGENAFVLNTKYEELKPVANVDSVLARGYWLETKEAKNAQLLNAEKMFKRLNAEPFTEQRGPKKPKPKHKLL